MAPASTTLPAQVTLEVFRYLPDQEEEPRYQRYEVPFREDWVVLDALNHIKDELDGSLSFRWSCRMGVCGSCGMMVNGEPKLTCAAFLRDYHPKTIRVEPLANFPVVRDLVINQDDFIAKLEEVKPWLIPKESRTIEEGEYRQSPAELARYKQFSMCINCLICYAACPVYALDSSFIGPAAIALAQRYNLDSRAEVISSNEGIWECTFVGECTKVCPKNVDPAGSIQMAKVPHTLDWFKSVLLPWGKR
ncbi:MAG: succinate dehydrogenase/fumarate reductase iron-sulfur subunit [Planctomycetota bacterium]|nr:succinate dehydrogenase/fumarate reductase iron-sulfur subunit [Planctomycetota bacterium]